MAKVNVKVKGAYVDGNAPGTEISIEEKSAKHLEAIGYVERVAAKPAPKKPATRKKKTETTEEK